MPVKPLIEAVRTQGHQALVDQAAIFDGATISHVRVVPAAVADALDTLDAEVRASLETSIEQTAAHVCR